MMKNFFKICQFVVISVFLATVIGCATPKANLFDDLPDKNRTKLGLYHTAIQSYELLKQNNKDVLLIDVRTPGELTSLGTPALTDVSVPIMLKPDKKMVSNDDFVPLVESYLKKRGLDEQSTILMICRNGRRSARAVNTLAEVGYKKVYSVIDGVEGWKSSDLPWTDKIDQEKMYQELK